MTCNPHGTARVQESHPEQKLQSLSPWSVVLRREIPAERYTDKQLAAIGGDSNDMKKYLIPIDTVVQLDSDLMEKSSSIMFSKAKSDVTYRFKGRISVTILPWVMALQGTGFDPS